MRVAVARGGGAIIITTINSINSIISIIIIIIMIIMCVLYLVYMGKPEYGRIAQEESAP